MSFEFVSYFGFRASSFLFSSLGALSAFARDGSHPIPDSHRAKTPRSQRSSFRFLPWRALRLRERPSLSDSLNPNSTENFKYVWLAFSNQIVSNTGFESPCSTKGKTTASPPCGVMDRSSTGETPSVLRPCSGW